MSNEVIVRCRCVVGIRRVVIFFGDYVVGIPNEAMSLRECVVGAAELSSFAATVSSKFPLKQCFGADVSSEKSNE